MPREQGTGERGLLCFLILPWVSGHFVPKRRLRFREDEVGSCQALWVPPPHVPELQCGRFPRFPNVELAQQEELGGGVVGGRLRVTPGWLSAGAEEAKAGKWGPGLAHPGVRGVQGRVEAAVGEGARLPCLLTPQPGHLPREVTAAAKTSFHS